MITCSVINESKLKSRYWVRSPDIFSIADGKTRRRGGRCACCLMNVFSRLYYRSVRLKQFRRNYLYHSFTGTRSTFVFQFLQYLIQRQLVVTIAIISQQRVPYSNVDMEAIQSYITQQFSSRCCCSQLFLATATVAIYW